MLFLGKYDIGAILSCNKYTSGAMPMNSSKSNKVCVSQFPEKINNPKLTASFPYNDSVIWYLYSKYLRMIVDNNHNLKSYIQLLQPKCYGL